MNYENGQDTGLILGTGTSTVLINLNPAIDKTDSDF